MSRGPFTIKAKTIKVEVPRYLSLDDLLLGVDHGLHVRVVLL